jgi:hypothetical protein
VRRRGGIRATMPTNEGRVRRRGGDPGHRAGGEGDGDRRPGRVRRRGRWPMGALSHR